MSAAWTSTNALGPLALAVGGDLTRRNRGRLLKTAKAGVYGNAADNDFTLIVSDGQRFDAGAAEDDVAFVGEIDLRASYPISRHVSLTGGYQLLWIDGVALASNEARWPRRP
jgi:hypothetical protein